MMYIIVGFLRSSFATSEFIIGGVSKKSFAAKMPTRAGISALIASQSVCGL
jgi:hypothetical protein